jgi:Mn2+/Fe2+ NRAMP family transporter
VAEPTRIPPVGDRPTTPSPGAPLGSDGAAARPEQADRPDFASAWRRTERNLPSQGRLQSFIRHFHVPRTLLLSLAVFGPGLIAANAGNDAGGIATYAQAGARYGYSLLWVLVIISVSLAVVQEMCARMGAVTGKGFSDLVREQFGIRWAFFVTLALFVANAGVGFSEFIGIAAAMELIGVSRYIAVPVAAFVLWFVVARGSNKVVERVFLIMTVAFFAYPISAFLAHPNWLSVGRHMIVPTFQANADYLKVMIALIGTTVTPYMQIYVQSAVVDKNVTPADYPLERVDVYVGTAFGNLIAMFIIVATGATLYVHQQYNIGSAADAARALEPLAGEGAKVLFAVGLLGASLLAAAVLPITTAFSAAEVFGFEKGVSMGFREAPVFMGIFTALMALGAAVALIPGLPVIQVLLVIQVVNGILLPVVLIAALKLTNDRELMGQYRNGPVFNTVAIATVVFVLALSSIYLLLTVLEPFGITFG